MCSGGSRSGSGQKVRRPRPSIQAFASSSTDSGSVPPARSTSECRAAAGQLDDPDDVYFLRSRDVKGDLRPVASTHRAHYQRELARGSVPRVITSEGETFFAAPAAAAGALEGVSASVGVYEGPVRVIREPRGASLEPGEVLVAPGTDPAWTPLFLTAGALVMEIGGIMSHGSVVAREYGIPAVVGVTDATTRLRTGQRVRVDGEAGTVLPLD